MKIKSAIDIYRLIKDSYTGEIFFDDNSTEYSIPVMYMINGEKVSEKEWKNYLFKKKLDKIIE